MDEHAKAVEAQTVTLTLEQTQQILNYLAGCPYGQVYQLVEILRAAAPGQNGSVA